MIKEALDILKTRPHNAIDLFSKDFKTLFTDEKFLSEILNLKWSEENYKQLSFFAHNIIEKGRMKCLEAFSEAYGFLPVYECFADCINECMIFQSLPFEVWSHLGKQQTDLVKTLFKERKLLKYPDKSYKHFLNYCDNELKNILKDKKVLSLLLEMKKSEDQYKKIMSLAHTIKKAPYRYFNLLPVYQYLQKYMYHWGRFYFDMVPFTDWSDLAEEGVSLLNTLIKEDKLDQFEKDQNYIRFFNKFEPRHTKLSKTDFSRINSPLDKDKSTRLKEIMDTLYSIEYEIEYFFYIQDKDCLNRFRNGEIISQLLEKKWSKKKYKAFIILSGHIHDQQQQRYYAINDTTYFEIPVIYACFEQYMGTSFIFQLNQIPWEEWADLAKEEIDVLKILFEKNELKNFENNKHYQSFIKRYNHRHRMLTKTGYYQLSV